MLSLLANRRSAKYTGWSRRQCCRVMLATLLPFVVIGTLLLLASHRNDGQTDPEFQAVGEKMVPPAAASINITRRMDPGAIVRWDGDAGPEYGVFLYKQWTLAFVKGIDRVERIFATPGTLNRVIERQADRQARKDQMASATGSVDDPLYKNELVRAYNTRSLTHYLTHRFVTIIDTSLVRLPDDPLTRNRFLPMNRLMRPGLLPELTPKSWRLRWEERLSQEILEATFQQATERLPPQPPPGRFARPMLPVPTGPWLQAQFTVPVENNHQLQYMINVIDGIIIRNNVNTDYYHNFLRQPHNSVMAERRIAVVSEGELVGALWDDNCEPGNAPNRAGEYPPRIFQGGTLRNSRETWFPFGFGGNSLRRARGRATWLFDPWVCGLQTNNIIAAVLAMTQGYPKVIPPWANALTFSPANYNTLDAYTALLGSPSGQWVMEFLTHSKSNRGNLVVTQIKLYQHPTDLFPSLAWRVGPISSDDQQRASAAILRRWMMANGPGTPNDMPRAPTVPNGLLNAQGYVNQQPPSHTPRFNPGTPGGGTPRQENPDDDSSEDSSDADSDSDSDVSGSSRNSENPRRIANPFDVRPLGQADMW